MKTLTDLLLRLPMFGGRKKKLSSGKLLTLKVLCVLLALVFAAGAVYMAVEKKHDVERPVYTANALSGARYGVKLSENSFFATDTLKQDGNYIRSIVKVINIVFTHDFTSGGTGAADLTYNVRGEMSTWINENNEERLLWSRGEELVSNTDIVVSGSDYKFEVPVNVYQGVYAKELDEFREEMEIDAIGYYDVTLTVTGTYNANGETKTETTTAVVSIPLNGKVFKPNIIADEKPTKTPFVRKDVDVTPSNWPMFALLALLALASVFALVVVVLCCEKKAVDPYLASLKAKIASVEERLAYVQGVNEMSGENIPLSDFDSIVRLADERVLPILCARDDEKRKAVFFVVENMQKFYYIFDDTKVEKD